MALSDDQKAMLRLLAERDVGLEDIAALKGMSVEEVRAEVDAALGEAGQAEEPAPLEKPTPQVRAESETAAAAAASEAKPVAQRAPAAKRRPSLRPSRKPSFASLPPERRRLVAIAGGALGLVAVVLIAIALLSDGSGQDATNSADAPDREAAALAANDDVTKALLQPVDGGDATGSAIFGRVGKDEVVLQVTSEGLEPSAEGESYTVWLYRSPKLALRVGSVKVEADEGQLGARFPIPAELLAYVAGGAFKQIYVSRTSDAAYQREVAQAQEQKRLPRYSGETVLRGEITGPLAEAPG